MIIDILKTTLRSLNSKLGNNSPKTIRTSISLLEEYEQKLTKHKIKRITRVLTKAIHDLTELKHSNEEFFRKEKLDESISGLVGQINEFSKEPSSNYKTFGEIKKLLDLLESLEKCPPERLRIDLNLIDDNLHLYFDIEPKRMIKLLEKSGKFKINKKDSGWYREGNLEGTILDFVLGTIALYLRVDELARRSGFLIHISMHPYSHIKEYKDKKYGIIKYGNKGGQTIVMALALKEVIKIILENKIHCMLNPFLYFGRWIKYP